MTAPTAPARMTAPPLVMRAPDCSLCGVEVGSDGDGWTCEECGFYWPFDETTPGEPIDDDREQCEETDGDVRCILTKGHGTAVRYPALERGHGIVEKRLRIHAGVEVDDDGEPRDAGDVRAWRVARGPVSSPAGEVRP